MQRSNHMTGVPRVAIPTTNFYDIYVRAGQRKEINRLKILQDVIDRNLCPGQAAEIERCESTQAPTGCHRSQAASWQGFLNARYPAVPLQPSAETLSPVRAAWYEQSLVSLFLT